jgi:hypothetical protein
MFTGDPTRKPASNAHQLRNPGEGVYIEAEVKEQSDPVHSPAGRGPHDQAMAYAVCFAVTAAVVI